MRTFSSNYKTTVNFLLLHDRHYLRIWIFTNLSERPCPTSLSAHRIVQLTAEICLPKCMDVCMYVCMHLPLVGG